MTSAADFIMCGEMNCDWMQVVGHNDVNIILNDDTITIGLS